MYYEIENLKKRFDELQIRINAQMEKVIVAFIEKYWRRMPTTYADYIPKEFLNNKVIVSKLLEKLPHFARNVSESLKDDRELMLNALKNNVEVYVSMSDRLKNDRELALIAVSINGQILSQMNDDFQNDKEIVLAAVKLHGEAFQYASLRLRNDVDVAKVAVLSCAKSYKFIGESLIHNKQLALSAVYTDGEMIKFMCDELKNDIEIITQATQNWPMAIIYAKDYLHIKEYIIPILERLDIFVYLAPELKNDRDVVLLAASNYIDILPYVSPEFCDDKEIMLGAIKYFPNNIAYASSRLRADREIALESLRNPLNIFYVDPCLYDDEEVLKKL